MADQSPMGRIIGINLAVMLAYAIGIRIVAVIQEKGQDEQMFFVLFLALAVAAHAVVDLCLAIALGILGHRDRALAFLASAPLVLLVGTGVCFGGAAIDLGGAHSR